MNARGRTALPYSLAQRGRGMFKINIGDFPPLLFPLDFFHAASVWPGENIIVKQYPNSDFRKGPN